MDDEARADPAAGHFWHYTVDDDGQPHPAPDPFAWADWMARERRAPDGGRLRVARTEWPDGWHLSTVFLGMDYALGDPGPVLWETMSFPDHCFYGRYRSQRAALAEHDRLVTEIVIALDRPPVRDDRWIPPEER